SETDIERLLKSSRKTSQKTLEKSSNAFFARRLPTKFSGNLPKSLESLPTSSVQNSTNIGYTLGRLLGKSSNAFYAGKLPTKSSESLLKSSAQNLSQTLEDFLEDPWKIFGKLMENSQKTLGRKSSNVFYARRLPTKSSESLLLKVVQRTNVKWSPSLSMLRNDI
ncbi:hypothetical protein IGI04_040125, partial [Brassica rapa subsp. trilocularis]